MKNAIEVFSVYIQHHDVDIGELDDEEDENYGKFLFCDNCSGCKAMSICDNLGFTRRPVITRDVLNDFMKQHPEYFI